MKAKQNAAQKRNFAIPGEAMSQEEFTEFIKAGEKGPFISLEEFKKEVQGWIRKAEK